MADYGVLAAICKNLTNDKQIVNQGLKNQIHLHQTKDNIFPMIVLEIEEIWTSQINMQGSPKARLKLKASTFSKNTGKESLVIADVVREIIDGKTMTLESGNKAVIKLENSVVDLASNNNGLRSVHQYYQAIVRG